MSLFVPTDPAAVTSVRRRAGAETLDARSASLLIGVSLAVALVVVLGLADRGFNLLDEAFYAQWIATPERYQYSIQPFGLFFHPFYDLLQRSIVGLRILGALMLAGSGAALGWSLARYGRAILSLDLDRWAFTFLGALVQLTYYVLWIPTPSYNLLANVSAAMVVAGCLGWLASGPVVVSRPLDALFSAMVGIGGYTAFLGKPPFAGVAAVGVAILLAPAIAAGRWRTALERAGVTAATCLVPLYLTVIYVMPVTAFTATVQGGMAAMNYGNSLTDLPLKTFRELKGAPTLLILTGSCAVVAAIWRWWKSSVRSHLAEVGALALLAANLLYLAWSAKWVIVDHRMYWDAFGPEIEAVVLAVIAYGVIRGAKPVNPRGLGLLLILLLLPFAIAFGTANPLVRQIGISLFGALLALAVAGPMLFATLTARAIQCGVALGSLALVVGAVIFPYRIPQSPPRQTQALKLPHFAGALRVDKGTARYAAYVGAIGRRAGLRADTPVLDLSGGGPGTALFLGGLPPGNPWLIQFFDNAVPMADAFWTVLSPAQRERAWIIGPIHPKFAPSAVAREVRRDRKRYACIGSTTVTIWEKPMVVDIWKPADETDVVPRECAGADLASAPTR